MPLRTRSGPGLQTAKTGQKTPYSAYVEDESESESESDTQHPPSDTSQHHQSADSQHQPTHAPYDPSYAPRPRQRPSYSHIPHLNPTFTNSYRPSAIPRTPDPYSYPRYSPDTIPRTPAPYPYPRYPPASYSYPKIRVPNLDYFSPTLPTVTRVNSFPQTTNYLSSNELAASTVSDVSSSEYHQEFDVRGKGKGPQRQQSDHFHEDAAYSLPALQARTRKSLDSETARLKRRGAPSNLASKSNGSVPSLVEEAYFTSAFDSNRNMLSMVFSVDKDSERHTPYTDYDSPIGTDSADASPWLQTTSYRNGDEFCKLLNIKALIHCQDVMGPRPTKLVSMNGPPPSVAAEPQIRWLHAEQNTLSLEKLKMMLVDCRFIPHDLMRVALLTLENVETRFSAVREGSLHIEPGATLRSVGNFHSPRGYDDPSGTSAVIFMSFPFLTLEPLSTLGVEERKESETSPKTILHTLYGYDVGLERENQQTVHKIQTGQFTGHYLHVRQFWALLVGDGVLITMCRESMTGLRGDSLPLDIEAFRDEDTVTVLVFDMSDPSRRHDNRYYIQLDRGYTYEDFLKHCVKLSTGSTDFFQEFRILDARQQVLTRLKWHLVTTSMSADTIFLHLERRQSLLAIEAPPDHGSSDGATNQPLASILESHRDSKPSNQLLPSEMVTTEGDLGLQLQLWTQKSVSLNAQSLEHAVPETTQTAFSKQSDVLDWIRSIPPESPRQSQLSDSIFYQRHPEGHPGEPVGSTSPSQSHWSYASRASRENWDLSARLQDESSSPKGSFTLHKPKESHESTENSSGKPERHTLARVRARGNVAGTDSYGSIDTGDADTHTSNRPKGRFESKQSRRADSVPVSKVRFAKESANRADTENESPRVGPPSDHAEQEDHGPTTGSAVTPCLGWRSRNQRLEAAPETPESALSGHLEQIKGGLQLNLRGNLYGRAFQCTKQQFLIRQTFHMQQRKLSTPKLDSSTLQSPIIDGQLEKGLPRVSLEPARSPGLQGAEKTATPSLQVPTGSSTPIIVKSDEDVRGLTGLYQNSNTLFGFFMPAVETSKTNEVALLFWGALDCIFRQVQWHRSAHYILGIDPLFAIHTPAGKLSTSGRSAVPVDDGCDTCEQAYVYATEANALDHWHEFHARCPSNTSPRPHDDPCLVWVHRVMKREQETSYNESRGEQGMGLLEDLILKSWKLRNTLDKLRHAASGSVGRPQPRGQGSSRFTLPPSLIRAFQQMLEMFILRSHYLCLKNRISVANKETRASGGKSALKPGEGPEKRKLLNLQKWENLAYDKAQAYMETAHHEMVMERVSRRSITSVGSPKIGIEFLVAVLIGNLQSKSPTLHLSSRPKHSQKDWLQLYQAYITKLRFRCYNRPQRKVFLDIFSFEEELSAISGLLETQRTLLENYLHLISTTTSGGHRTDRAVEKREIEWQIAQLDRQAQEVKNLQDKSAALKEQVKQAIEVLEEGHGKAIRVFTIVTLFFLPLSFVSTFLGMNTTDIDGLKWDQRIFWATSLPITAVVLVIAFLYAYKSDEISDSLRKNVRIRAFSPSGNKGPQQGGNEKLRLLGGKAFGGIKKRRATDSFGLE